ncbi:MAG: hypothetical protein EPO32_13225 [Anaerolineae bacterium]|nr:MAG: hypothetical protein EPO32_13225 [Anaerolineae bacterium]
MRRIMSFVFGAALGGLVGAVVALLWAPYSGEKLRDEFRIRASSMTGELKEAMTSRRLELEHQLAELRKPRPAAHPEG